MCLCGVAGKCSVVKPRILLLLEGTLQCLANWTANQAKAQRRGFSASGGKRVDPLVGWRHVDTEP